MIAKRPKFLRPFPTRWLRTSAAVLLLCVIFVIFALKTPGYVFRRKTIPGGNVEFHRAVRQAVGVYEDLDERAKAFNVPPRSLAESKDLLSNTVVVASTNMGFIDFAFNWACMAKKLQPYKFIIVSQDPESNVYLKSNTLLSTFDGAAIGVDSTAAQSAWRSPAYNHIVKMKVLIVRQILEMGYHVLFSDVDIVWLDDPLKYFVGDVDWEFEPNELGDDFQPGNTANTGFYWIKSSKKTIDLMKTVEVEAAKVPDLDDQTVWSILLNDFWQNGTYVYVPAAEKSAQDYLLKLNRNDDPLTFRQLNSVQFPPGNKYFGKPRDEWEAESARTGLTAVFGHITFVIGHDIKMQALKDNGMWSVKDGALEEAKAWVENRKQKLGDRWTEIEQLNQNREEGLFCMKQGH